jgi:hypothetical protein
MTSLEAIRDAITRRRHSPIPAPSRVEVLRATHHMHYLEQLYKARLSILILSKTYPPKRKTLPLIMHGFWLVGLFAKKQLGSWILTFNILAQILVRLPLLP